MTAVFEVLAEPHRRRIVELLGDRERPVGELVAALRISQPAVSKHLRVLRDAGLVEPRVDAQRRLYRVRTEPLEALDDWLAPFRAQWSGRLDALERHLATMPAADRPPDAVPTARAASTTTPRRGARRAADSKRSD